MTSKTVRPLSSISTLRAALIAGLVTLGSLAWASESSAGSKAEVDGALDREAIRAVVKANIDDVRVCYNAELIEDDSVAGEIVIGFTITERGAVVDAVVTESTMPARFDACLTAAVQGWAFPTSDGPTQVRYPFAMTSE